MTADVQSPISARQIGAECGTGIAAVLAAPHLVGALAGGLLFLVWLFATAWAADRLASRQIYSIAGSRYAQKDLGLVLQEKALAHPDLLPLYGSSEIDRLSAYHAREVFAGAPTGFSPFTVARPGTLLFETMQNLGALGSRLRDRKVVVSLSPPMFLQQEGEIRTTRYAGNFSPLHALTLLLTSDLSISFRRDVARRLLKYPPTLERNKILEATATLMADATPLHRPLLYAVLPLAHAQRRLLAADDELLFVGHALTSHDPNPAAAVAELTPPLDWSRLESEATRQFEAHARNNPFSVDDDWWAENAGWAASQKNQSSDAQFLDDLSRSETWIDLEQLLQVTQRLQAKVLILSMPFDARFMAYTGVTKTALHEYYERVRSMVATYGAQAVVFDDHESDSFFFYDLYSHISPKGWVHYDQALDAFYHDALH